MIDRVQWSTGAAVGADGAATATGYSALVRGEVLAVHVAYVHSPPGTTDVTLTDEADPATAESIITLVDANSNIKIYPRRLLETNDGTDLTYDATRKVYGCYAVHGRLKAVIAQANAADSVMVTAWVKR